MIQISCCFRNLDLNASKALTSLFRSKPIDSNKGHRVVIAVVWCSLGMDQYHNFIFDTILDIDTILIKYGHIHISRVSKSCDVQFTQTV